MKENFSKMKSNSFKIEEPTCMNCLADVTNSQINLDENCVVFCSGKCRSEHHQFKNTTDSLTTVESPPKLEDITFSVEKDWNQLKSNYQASTKFVKVCNSS
eukprot:gene8815-765_t